MRRTRLTQPQADGSAFPKLVGKPRGISQKLVVMLWPICFAPVLYAEQSPMNGSSVNLNKGIDSGVAAKPMIDKGDKKKALPEGKVAGGAGRKLKPLTVVQGVLGGNSRTEQDQLLKQFFMGGAKVWVPLTEMNANNGVFYGEANYSGSLREKGDWLSLGGGYLAVNSNAFAWKGGAMLEGSLYNLKAFRASGLFECGSALWRFGAMGSWGITKWGYQASGSSEKLCGASMIRLYVKGTAPGWERILGVIGADFSLSDQTRVVTNSGMVMANKPIGIYGGVEGSIFTWLSGFIHLQHPQLNDSGFNKDPSKWNVRAGLKLNWMPGIPAVLNTDFKAAGKMAKLNGLIREPVTAFENGQFFQQAVATPNSGYRSNGVTFDQTYCKPSGSCSVKLEVDAVNNAAGSGKTLQSIQIIGKGTIAPSSDTNKASASRDLSGQTGTVELTLKGTGQAGEGVQAKLVFSGNDTRWLPPVSFVDTDDIQAIHANYQLVVEPIYEGFDKLLGLATPEQWDWSTDKLFSVKVQKRSTATDNQTTPATLPSILACGDNPLDRSNYTNLSRYDASKPQGQNWTDLEGPFFLDAFLANEIDNGTARYVMLRLKDASKTFPNLQAMLAFGNEDTGANWGGSNAADLKTEKAYTLLSVGSGKEISAGANGSLCVPMGYELKLQPSSGETEELNPTLQYLGSGGTVLPALTGLTSDKTGVQYSLVGLTAGKLIFHENNLAYFTIRSADDKSIGGIAGTLARTLSSAWILRDLPGNAVDLMLFPASKFADTINLQDFLPSSAKSISVDVLSVSELTSIVDRLGSLKQQPTYQGLTPAKETAEDGNNASATGAIAWIVKYDATTKSLALVNSVSALGSQVAVNLVTGKVLKVSDIDTNAAEGKADNLQNVKGLIYLKVTPVF